VVAVKVTSVHGFGETVPDDPVKFAVPWGAPLGAPAEVFVTVAVQTVKLPSVIEGGVHVTETLVLAAGRGVGVRVGVAVGGPGVRAGVSVATGVGFGVKPGGINAVTQFSPESPPVLFWSPSCTMNSNRYAWLATNGFPCLSCRLARLKRISAA
jgi:hypothetical protein